MMRKLAIASLLVAGVALSGSVFAQDSTAPAKAPAAKHHTTSSSSTKKSTHKSTSHTKKSSAPASTGSAGK